METKITAVIAEDVEKYHSVIETFLEEVAPHVQVVGKSATLAATKALINEVSPQLVFLDIQFEAEGQTAFDFLEELSLKNYIDFKIIFITAFNQTEYYDEAFRYGAIHFLTKPIDKIKLKEAIDRVTATIYQLYDSQIIKHFLKIHEHIHLANASNKIVIEGINVAEIVRVDDIVFFEASGRYTYIHLINSKSKSICSTSNIGVFERRLNLHRNFIRVNRDLIVNSDYILRFSKKDRSLILPEPFPTKYASKERFKEFLRYLENQE